MMQLDRGTWMRFAIWMALGILEFWQPMLYVSLFSASMFKKVFNVLSNNVLTIFVGFLIYFSYGIRNSSEAVLNRSDTPACTIEGKPMTTDKAYFLHTTPNDTGDDDFDS